MLTTAVVVGVGSLVAGAAGLYASGSTGPSTGITKTVEDSVSAVTQQVSDATQQVQPEDIPEPVTPPVEQPVAVEPPKPVEQPVEPEQPVEQPVEPVEPPKPVAEPVQNLTDAERERLNILLDRDSMHPMQGQSLTAAEEKELADLRSRQNPSFPETDSMAGGQRGGYGRPTWAPVRSQQPLIESLGLTNTPAATAIATVTGSKTPQQIQQELVNIDREIRAAATQQFQINEKFNEELEKFNGTSGVTGIRQEYLGIVGQVSYWKFMEKLSSDKLRSFNGVPEPVAAVTTDLQAEFDKEFKKKDEVGPAPKKEFKVWLKDSIDLVKKRKKSSFRGEKPPANEAEYAKWYTDLKSKTATSTASGSTSRMTEAEYTAELKKEIDAARNKEDYIFRESMKKPEYDESMTKLTELRSKRSEIVNKLKELIDKKQLLLEELSAYKVPTSFWDKTKQPEVPKSTVPTGEELNRLLVDYKAKQEEIKQKEEAINEELSLQLKDDGTLTDDTAYRTLKTELETLQNELKSIIDKIEGRHVDQTRQLKEFSELDKFIKQLKDLKVKAVTVFDNPDFRKVFDMLTVMSLDTDPTSFIVNLDKYSNFFVTTKGLSAYNGEVLDKVFYFLNNYNKLIKDARTLTIIGLFGTKFKSENIENTRQNIENTKTFLENSGDTTTEEFKKLDATQRRILEGRSTAWHTFFTDSDTLKAIPKAFSSVLFKTELDKIVKLEAVIKRRILDKIDKTKFETVIAPTGPSWYSKYLPDVTAWFTSKPKPADRAQFLLEFCKRFKKDNQKNLKYDKEFEKYDTLINEKKTKGLKGDLKTMSEAISELEKAITNTEKERDRRLDPKLKRRIQADIDDYMDRKTTLETTLNSYKNELNGFKLLKEKNKGLAEKLELLKDDENCLKNAEAILKDIRLLNRCDEIYQRVLRENKSITDKPKLEQYLRSALRQQGDFSSSEIETCIKRKLDEVEDPFDDCVNFVYSELTGDERNGKIEITDARIQEIVNSSNGKMNTEQVKACIVKAKERNPKLPGTPLTPIVIKVDSVTHTTVKLSWTGAEGATFSLRPGTPPIASPYTITGLTPDTEYTYRISGNRGIENVVSEISVRTTKSPVVLEGKFEIGGLVFGPTQIPTYDSISAVNIPLPDIVFADVPQQVYSFEDGNVSSVDALNDDNILFFSDTSNALYSRESLVNKYVQKDFTYECANDFSPAGLQVVSNNVNENMARPFVRIDMGSGENFLLTVPNFLYILKSNHKRWKVSNTGKTLEKTVLRQSIVDNSKDPREVNEGGDVKSLPLNYEDNPVDSASASLCKEKKSIYLASPVQPRPGLVEETEEEKEKESEERQKEDTSIVAPILSHAGTRVTKSKNIFFTIKIDNFDQLDKSFTTYNLVSQETIDKVVRPLTQYVIYRAHGFGINEIITIRLNYPGNRFRETTLNVKIPTSEQYDTNPEQYDYRSPEEKADIAARAAAREAAKEAAAKEAAAKELAAKELAAKEAAAKEAAAKELAAKEAAAKELAAKELAAKEAAKVAEQDRRQRVGQQAILNAQEAIKKLFDEPKPNEENFLENVLNYIMLNKYTQVNYEWAVGEFSKKFPGDFLGKVEQKLKTAIFSADFTLYFRFLYLYYKLQKNQAKLAELEAFYKGVYARKTPVTLTEPFEKLNLKGGNHETRRHRVRGMPKRAKTRRMY